MLSGLSSKEVQEFSVYLESRFVGASEAETSLLQCLLEGEGQVKASLPARESIWETIKPGQDYDDQRFRLILSGLLKHLHRFLAITVLDREPAWEQLLTLRRIGEKGMEKYFLQQLKKARKANLARRNQDFEMREYLLESEFTRFLRQNPRQLQPSFDVTHRALDRWYLLEKLRLACAALNNQYVVDQEVAPGVLEEINAFYNRRADLRSPLMEVLYRVMRLLSASEDETDGYRMLLNLLDLHSENLRAAELGVIYTYIQNHCIRQINRGNSAYLRELFHIYCRLLELGLLLEHGQLSPWHFKNIMTVALRLKEFDWAETFIQEKVKLISADFRDNARTYNLAKLYFHQGEYSKVKKLLVKVEYEDVFYNLDSKTMLLKVYYEEGEDIALEALARTFLAYLRRNKLVSPDHRIRYSNFVRTLLKISQLWSPLQEDLQEIAARLEPGTDHADVAWLRKVLRELGEVANR